jgi:hypothetical protein
MNLPGHYTHYEGFLRQTKASQNNPPHRNNSPYSWEDARDSDCQTQCLMPWRDSLDWKCVAKQSSRYPTDRWLSTPVTTAEEYHPVRIQCNTRRLVPRRVMMYWFCHRRSSSRRINHVPFFESTPVPNRPEGRMYKENERNVM